MGVVSHQEFGCRTGPCAHPCLFRFHPASQCKAASCKERNTQCATCDAGTPPNDVCLTCVDSFRWKVDGGTCVKKTCVERDPSCAGCNSLDLCTGCTDPLKILDKYTKLWWVN